MSKTFPLHHLVKIKECKFQFHSQFSRLKNIYKTFLKTGSFTWKLKNIYNSQEHNIKIKTELSFSVSFSNKIYIIYIITFHWFPLIPRKNKLVPILPEEREDLPGEGDTEPAEMMVPSKNAQGHTDCSSIWHSLGTRGISDPNVSYVCCICIRIEYDMLNDTYQSHSDFENLIPTATGVFHKVPHCLLLEAPPGGFTHEDCRSLASG